MRSTVVRVMVVVFVVAVAAGAAFQFSSLLSRARQIDRDERAVLTTIDHIDTNAAELGGMIGVSAILDDSRWSDRETALATQIPALVADLRSRTRSAAAGTTLQSIADALTHLDAAEDKHETVMDIRAAAGELRAAEEAAFEIDRTAAERQLLLVPGVAAGGFVLALLLLVWIPRPSAAIQIDGTPGITAPASTDAPATSAPMPAQDVAEMPDLAAAADLCMALSRIDSVRALPDMLARAAALLDASGVILWMGAGEDLYAAASHGYDPRMIRRLGAIPRHAENATAAAWRTGQLRTVPGDVMSNGAIVAPMFGPDGCIGVLAAEVRNAREDDAAARAVTSIVAAQLATVVAAWPAASTTSGPRAAEA
ncbi:MAG TPA: GAF domain-containing protein [Vicinamibacterales bacterium]|jgi:hypothetical protein|nr:GAF domain-containing protein [Vicinamibacterales bacterium]